MVYNYISIFKYKFQTFKTELVVTKKARKAEYQKKAANKIESQYEMLKKLELSEDMHKELLNYTKYKNIIFLSTPFDIESINLLHNLGLQTFKISSGDITNLPYLRYIGRLGKKIILSTGMANLKEIEKAFKILRSSGTKKDNITILHANTEYPTPIEDVNLKAMITIGNTFDVSYGYSDHTLGMEVSIAAVAMGASCIEKHFTLDSNMSGPDHKASLNPNELKNFIRLIRNVEIALGTDTKKPSKSEIPNIKVVRKSIIANSNINKGETLNENNVSVKRPGNGISPMEWDKIIGTMAKKNYKKDDLI